MSGDAISHCEFDGRKLIVRIDTQIPADVQAINPAVDDVMAVTRMMHCAEGKEFEIETALREALANAICHGARNDAAKRVHLWVGCDEARGMLIVVRDPGAGFDPTTLPSPIEGECLFLDHGRGIYLINRLVDHVHFERGGTEIHMRIDPKRND